METRKRFARIDDIPTLLLHRRGMFRDMGHTEEARVAAMLVASDRFLKEAFEDGSYCAWIAEVGGAIAGSLAIHILPWIPGFADPSPRRAYVHNLYIEPEFRRRGIARTLMQSSVDWCRERNFRSVTLHASDQGRLLYETMGFTPTNEMRLIL